MHRIIRICVRNVFQFLCYFVNVHHQNPTYIQLTLVLFFEIMIIQYNFYKYFFFESSLPFVTYTSKTYGHLQSQLGNYIQ